MPLLKLTIYYSQFETSQSRASLFRSSHPTTPKPTPPPPQQNVQPLYIVVFGYPPDKYSVTVEYFRSLGETTEAEQSSELLNCFRIGYLHPPEAIRAIRKNGEILGGSWMVGAKWAVRFSPATRFPLRNTDMPSPPPP